MKPSFYFVNKFKDKKEEGLEVINLWIGKYGFDITIFNLTLGVCNE